MVKYNHEEGKNMDANYLKILDKITFFKADIEKLYNAATNTNSFENRKASIFIENIIEQLGDAEYTLKRLSKPTIEGKLQENTELEKFEFIRKDNGKGLGWYFTCSNYLEVKGDDGEWYSGRVEHTTRDGNTGYYFYNTELGHPFLYTGMVARIRDGN